MPADATPEAIAEQARAAVRLVNAALERVRKAGLRVTVRIDEYYTINESPDPAQHLTVRISKPL